MPNFVSLRTLGLRLGFVDSMANVATAAEEQT